MNITHATGDCSGRSWSWDGTVSRLCKRSRCWHCTDSSTSRWCCYARRPQSIWCNGWWSRWRIWRVLWLYTVLNVLQNTENCKRHRLGHHVQLSYYFRFCCLSGPFSGDHSRLSQVPIKVSRRSIFGAGWWKIF